MERALLIVDATKPSGDSLLLPPEWNFCYAPSLGSETTNISSSFFFFFFFSPSAASPLPPVTSTRNLDSESVNRPSWIAVRSSTAVAVDVNRWIAWTFNLSAGQRYFQAITCPAQSDRVPSRSRLVGALGRLELLPQVLVVNLGIVAELEDNETDGRLGEDEHVGRAMRGGRQVKRVKLSEQSVGELSLLLFLWVMCRLQRMCFLDGCRMSRMRLEDRKGQRGGCEEGGSGSEINSAAKREEPNATSCHRGEDGALLIVSPHHHSVLSGWRVVHWKYYPGNVYGLFSLHDLQHLANIAHLTQ
jgi:hypothetical protein